jgi:hypothetical protein
MSDARQTRAAAGTIVTIYLSKGSTMPHTLVLAVGRDAVLLEMRSKVLQAAGYTVIPELSLKKQWPNSAKETLALCSCVTPFPPKAGNA